MLELTDVVKTYPAADSERPVTALRIKRFVLGREETVALVGPSGSGKSTLLNLIAGIIRPTSGSIKWNGEELTRLGERQWDEIRTKQIGYVFQHFYLLPGFTALENVMLAMQFAGTPKGREREKRAKQWLDRVGLIDRLHHKPHQLSSGEQQRVAIARALVNEPELVLADEPTANLDEANALSVIRLLTEACAEQRAALLLSTHDRRLVQFAGRTVRLSGGHIIGERSEDVQDVVG